jgi:hypothetical protein
MSSNIKIFLLCPVPNDQKPINEYIDLKENELINWTTLSNKKYQEFLFFRFLTIFFLFFPFTFSQIHFYFESLLINFLISLILLVFLLIGIFIRWEQVKQRFLMARLFYEEASWYDGQIWEKPLELIKNDKFITTQKIQPILNRLRTTLINFGILIILTFLILQFF